MVAKKIQQGSILTVVLLIALATPLHAQEQVVEYGRIVQADDGTGSLDYIVGEDNYAAREDKKAWIPVLSPVMIRLDCWITRMVNIHQFYSQQAADEYWAMAEYCSDIPLSMDPNIYNNTGLKYTVLAPIYAWCPGMLNRRGLLGGCGGYGIPSPMPSVQSMGYYPSGSPGPYGPATAPVSSSMSSPMVPSGGMELQPMPMDAPVNAPSMAPSVSAPTSVEPPRNQIASSSSSSWSQMSDAEILAHFGLDPSMAARAQQRAQLDGSKLEEPVVQSEEWQFAEEAPTVSLEKKEVVALNHDSYPPSVEPLQLPEPVVVSERVISKPSVQPKESMMGQEPRIELEYDDQVAPSDSVKKGFSSTDAEYDKMRDIEKELLGF
ncbi:MAG: hypothetical protein KC978_11325 [Candidatus Omnitrophica bacterium]|nr:hypothetical protein [Candidatus Omnitrophota bacterium]